ncbi:MAG: hypothetical protein J5569_00215 [Oscillospiraceae bacterium]|nr:hypothetical protein [Oscillospiraceae bacterium]
MRNWLGRFMAGRYGPDQLNIALIIAGVICGVIADITRFIPLTIVAYAAIIYALMRLLSRNIEKRRRENDRFLTMWWPVRQKLIARRDRFRDRKSYRFFNCPSCGKTLRVPKNKGRIQITCPKCGERFIKKT